MSLHTLGRFGLLTKETTIVLTSIDKNYEFKDIDRILYDSGFTSSISHANRILFEIKKRIILKKDNLPDINYLITAAKTNFNSIVKAQIYFVYLYNTDIYVSYLTDKLGEIYNSNYDNPEISRESIKNILKTYLTSNSIKVDKKTVTNWIGRYLSIMREIKILIRKRNHEYFINFMGIMPETWYFFALHSHFNKYSLEKSEFFKIFQINPKIIPKILQNLENENSNINKMINAYIENSSVKIETTYNNMQEWAENIK